jgi:hypothetical protein
MAMMDVVMAGVVVEVSWVVMVAVNVPVSEIRPSHAVASPAKT